MKKKVIWLSLISVAILLVIALVNIIFYYIRIANIDGIYVVTEMTVYNSLTKNSTSNVFGDEDYTDKGFDDFETCLMFQDDIYKLKISNITYDININEEGEWKISYDHIKLIANNQEKQLKYERNGMNIVIESGDYIVTFRFVPLNKLV